MAKSIWVVPLLLLAATIYSLAGSAVTTTSTLPVELDQFMEAQQSLPRYEESGYSPLGRSPVVDALLGDPYLWR